MKKKYKKIKLIVGYPSSLSDDEVEVIITERLSESGIKIANIQIEPLLKWKS